MSIQYKLYATDYRAHNLSSNTIPLYSRFNMLLNAIKNNGSGGDTINNINVDIKGIKDAVTDTIKENPVKVDPEEFKKIRCEVIKSKNEIIETLSTNCCDDSCCPDSRLATKGDIEKAINEINTNTNIVKEEVKATVNEDTEKIIREVEKKLNSEDFDLWSDNMSEQVESMTSDVLETKENINTIKNKLDEQAKVIKEIAFTVNGIGFSNDI